MKLDLEAANVALISTTSDAIRGYFDGATIEEVIPGFDTALDDTQGLVYGKESGVAYLVIEVKP